ncbi:class I SAM-dependent methyltransferase [Geminocystis herdmanii]|uniref:class I SAM-dependent methyltransferase n=1 Tax=Geminocystis herdmanii TaxID=669359 RepID=UPI00034A3447|nr:class I SAM-dependent methyltransferase [Geminocystis herdmanii]
MNQTDKLNLAYECYRLKKYSQAAQLFEEAIEEKPTLLQSGLGVTLAHSLILSLDWEKIASYLPPKTNILEASGWLKSLQLGKPVNNETESIPWYTYPAIEFIEDKIKSDFVVFEYGSGQSTLWWAKKINQLISIESNKDWFNYLRSTLIKDPKIILKLIEEPDVYIKTINEFPDKYFDVIIIDGDNREECAKEAYSHLKEDGFIIFDDTDRSSYSEILTYLDSEGFYRLDFFGMTPCLVYKNCTSVLFKDLNFLKNKSSPSQKKSCLGKSFSQPDKEKEMYFDDLDSLSIFEELGNI